MKVFSHIDNQPTSNYAYDQTGNLIKDSSEEISAIEWTVYGKVRRVNRQYGSAKPFVGMRYGADGNRWVKVSRKDTVPDSLRYTYYVRDAHGNTMATYTRSFTEKNELNNDDYPAFIDTLIAVIGDTNYHAFIANQYGTDADLLDMLYDTLTTDGAEDTVLRHYSGYWLTQHDATLEGLVEAAYSDSILILAALTADISGVKAIISGNSTYLDAYYKAVIDYDCSGYLNALEVAYSGTVSALYTNLVAVLGGTASTTAAQIGELCSGYYCGGCGTPAWYYFHAAMATYLRNNITPQAFDVVDIFFSLNQMAYAVKRAGAATDVRAMSSIMQYLNLYDTALYNGYVRGAYSKADLLTIIKNNDPNGFVYYGLRHKYKLAGYFLKSKYNISSFTSDIAGNMPSGSSILAIVLDRMHVGAGNLREKFSLGELDIYGSKRLGVVNENKLLVKMDYHGTILYDDDAVSVDAIYDTVFTATLPVSMYSRTLGKVSYELSNHLGNVLVTVSDRKLAHSTNTTTIDWYNGDVRSVSGMYAYGSPMGDKQYVATNYRHGYQGSEKDDEISGFGNTINTFYREADLRKQQWNSIDPKPNASESPYVSMGDNPIWHNDVMGDKIIIDPSFKKNKFAMASYNKWSQSKEGKSFLKDYDKGGKYWKDELVFNIYNKNNPKSYTIQSGGTKTYANDKFLSKGDKLTINDKVRFYISLDAAVENKPIFIVDNAETLLHESQHVRIIQFGRAFYGTYKYGISEHHQAMNMNYNENHIYNFKDERINFMIREGGYNKKDAERKTQAGE